MAGVIAIARQALKVARRLNDHHLWQEASPIQTALRHERLARPQSDAVSRVMDRTSIGMATGSLANRISPLRTLSGRLKLRDASRWATK